MRRFLAAQAAFVFFVQGVHLMLPSASFGAPNNRFSQGDFKMIVNNDGSISANDVFSIFSKTDVLFFGDTKHSNPAVKGAVFGILPQLHEAGFSKIWLELDKKNQEKFDLILRTNPTYESILSWVPAKNGGALHVTMPFPKNHFLSISCAKFPVTTKN